MFLITNYVHASLKLVSYKALHMCAPTPLKRQCLSYFESNLLKTHNVRTSLKVAHLPKTANARTKIKPRGQNHPTGNPTASY